MKTKKSENEKEKKLPTQH